MLVHSTVLDLGFRITENPCVTEMWEADLIIVPDPRKVADDIRFIAGLRGSMLCAAEFVRTRGSHGVAVAYSKAMSVQRKIYVTPRFMGVHTECCRALLQLLRLQQCKWTPLSRQQVATIMGARLDAKRLNQTIVLCEEDEAQEYQVLKHVLNMQRALASPCFVQEDSSRSRTGLAAGF